MCACVHMYVFICVCSYVCVFMCACVHMRVFICVCSCVHVSCVHWASEARLSLTSLKYIYIWQSSKRSIRVHPRRLLKK